MTYRAVSDRAKAIHGDEPFEADLSAADEADEVSGGHLEIVPRPYRVLVDNFVYGDQNAVVDLALSQGVEAALLSGGIVERADASPKKKAAKKAAAASTQKVE